MHRVRMLLPLALSLALLPGCAGLLRSYDVAPSGLARREEELRRALLSGQADSALVQRSLQGKQAPSDELLRTLYGGVTAFYAGRYAESGALLDVASALADDRMTKSLSRSALALISNDLALPYETSRTERLMIPYYGALAYLRLNDLPGATVEARRLSGLLEQYGGDVAPETAGLFAALRYFAGAIFEAAGELNDAAVAYRNAAGLAGLDTIAPRVPGDSGDVVLVLEQGFVVHRAPESLNVLLAPNEVFGLREGEPRARFDVAGLVAARILESATAEGAARRGPRFVGPPAGIASADRDQCEDVAPANAPGIGDVLRPDSGKVPVRVVARRNRARRCQERDDDVPYLLRVAWPTLRWTSRPPQGAAVFAGETSDSAGSPSSPAANAVFADVSASAAHDFRTELPLIVARTVARGAAKAAITKGAGNKLEKKHDGLGKLVGLLGNLGNALLERADTRCWHLLPGGIGIARLRLPPGEHTLRVALPDGREVRLEDVRVSAGGVAVVSARAW